MYSQFGEDDVILRYFGNYKGVLLDIGANDGTTLSNSRALIEKGWIGDLVEPAAVASRKLKMLYKDNPGIKIHDYAIDVNSGISNFYESSSAYRISDSGLFSTLKEAHMVSAAVDLRTGGIYPTQFTQYEIETLSFKDFQEKALYKMWDFITIDAEGCDWDILQQINLSEVGCKCLCIEYNGYDQDKYINYGKEHGMSRLFQNDVNIIICKKNH